MKPTVLVASAGWLVGMLVPLAFEMRAESSDQPIEEPSALATVAFAASFGAAIGALFGLAQWVVLRCHVERGGRWILGNVVGWALGLPFTYLGGALVSEGSSTAEVALVATLAAALMGFGVSLGT